MKQSNFFSVRIFSVVAILFVMLSLSAQTQIEPFVPGATIEGVSYFLPRTALRVVITAEKTKIIPGEYHMYAYKYMRLQDVPNQVSVTWRIKDIKMLSFGVPDKSKAYSLKIKGHTTAPLVSLSSEGLLLGINTDVEEITLPALSPSRIIETAITPTQVRACMTRDMLQASSMAKIAELAAREIYDIRESRDALVRGEADNTPKDGAQLKLMLDNIDSQQQVLYSLFVGSREVSEHTFAIDVVPGEEHDKLLLFRFSKWLGLVDADDMSGTPYYLSIKSCGELPEPVADPKTDKAKAKLQRAVYYNVPARGEVRIFNADETFVKAELPIAQFGFVDILSNQLFDKMGNTRVSFFQATGGVKEIKTQSQE